MKNNINYAALSMNDIIFQDRNKEYGAYELRESYNRRIKQSLLGAMLLTFLACSYQTLYSLHHPVASLAEQKTTVTTTEVQLPKEAIKPPDPIQPPKPQGTPDPITSVAAGILIPTDNAQATDSIPANDQLAQTVISDHAGGTTIGSNFGTPDGDIDISVHTPAAPSVTETVDFAEVMPEYPGGEQAMMKFLADNIQYPYIDRELGNHGRVVVGFVIDENGRVTDIKILKGITKTMNEESMRVVSKLKFFKPGMQGGHKVKVRYNLPINYTLGSED